MGWDAAPGMQKQSTGMRWGWGEQDRARTQPQGQAAGMLLPSSKHPPARCISAGINTRFLPFISFREGLAEGGWGEARNKNLWKEKLISCDRRKR